MLIIGAIHVDRLAARDHDLTLVARSETKLAELARTLRDRHGAKVRASPVDLSSDKGVLETERLLGEVSAFSGLVNNAGIGASRSWSTAIPMRCLG